MEVIGQLQKQYVDFVTSIYHEGFLDDQFLELQKLRDDSNPNFVAEVVSLFFDDSEKLINNLATALHQQVVDYKQVDAHVHQFKGSSSSIGANKVKNACVDFRSFCDLKNIEGRSHDTLCTLTEKSLFYQLPGPIEPCTAAIDRRYKLKNEREKRCLACLQNVKREYYLVKSKLEILFRLEEQIMAAGGVVPMLA